MAHPLSSEKYVSIRTFRKNGEAKHTPVWIADLDGKLVFVTNEDSWKVKRMKNNPAVALAPCDMKGNNAGTYLDGTARIVQPDERDAIDAAIRKKYGWQTWPFALISKFSKVPRVGIEITLDG